MIEIGTTDRVFVLTGAGISAESGIPTFRDSNGLWRQYRAEEIASPRAFAANPELVWQFYSERRRGALPCKPNPAHFALAQLEQRLGERLFICTQNVDSLHEQAGAQRVVHMHGWLFKSRCAGCDRAPFDDTRAYDLLAEVARCPCGALIRPHICWFGEMPFEMDRIYEELRQCTIFVSVGSSGVVYPAAGFVSLVRGQARTYYVGPEAPANELYFDQCFEGNAGKVVPTLFAVGDGVLSLGAKARV
jgi:NAD-dependent deacetylase